MTVHGPLLEALQQRADREGRSLSNLAAWLLESAMDRMDNVPQVSRTWDTQVNSRDF